MVVTPTASGKTLCYNLPVLSAILRNQDSRALYLFPTKALALDQAGSLYDLIEAMDVDVKAYTYDGDTQAAARKAIRQAGHIVVTNPDMMHANILPHHTKWVKLFENLKYIVIDEIHMYRGVFGSHLANVLRRLMRLCAFYGSKPKFILCSATIANPAELGEMLTGRHIEKIDNNGAPVGKNTSCSIIRRWSTSSWASAKVRSTRPVRWRRRYCTTISRPSSLPKAVSRWRC